MILLMSEKQAKLLDLGLRNWNLLLHDTKYFFHNLHNEFNEFFPLENRPIFCKDVCSVMEILAMITM